MHTAGGAYRTHHHPPPPPPSPPPPPQLPSSLSSSSSTLSALAPPFTLDHAFPSPPPLHPNPPVAPQPHHVSLRPPASRLAPHTSAAGSLGSLPSTVPLVDPYYGRYYSNSQGQSFDDSFGSSSSYSRVGCSPWNGPFDEEAGRGIRADAVSSWMGPTSGHEVPNFQEEHAADDRCYYDNDSFGVWHGKLTDSLTGLFGSQHSEWLQDKHVENYGDMTSSYSVFNAPFSTPSTSLGVHSSGTMGSTSAKGSHDTFVINSTYDRYMAQLDSCSVNPLVCYPSATCSTSPTTFKAGPNINSTLQSTTVHDVPYKINEPLTTTSKLKEPCLNQKIGIRGGDDEKRLENYSKPRIVTITTPQPAEFLKHLTLSKNDAIESHLNSSVGLNPELKLKNVVNADAHPARCCSMEPDKSIRSSSEALDQHNLAVDSPCWKGAPASRQSPFTVDSMLVKAASVESKDLNDPSQDQNHLLEDAGNPQGSAEQVGRLNLDKYKNNFISENPKLVPVVSSCLHQNSESGDKKLSDHRKDNHENEFLCDDVHRKQINTTAKVKKRDSEGHGVGSTNFVEIEHTTVNNFPPEDTDENDKGTCSSPQINTKDLVKAIHNYSVDLLLSTNFSNDELEPPYYRLLYSAINNISLVLGDSKGFAGFSHCSGPEAAQSCKRCLNAEDVNQSNMNQTCKVKGKMHSVGCNVGSDEYDNFGVKGSEAGPRKVNDMTQTIENALSETFPDREENEWILLYKNLWIEAETATCRLKYELQLARMKIESENPKPPLSDISSSLPCAPDLKGYNSHSKAKISSLGTISPSLCSGSQYDASACHGLNKSEDIESSVMSRLNVLQSRNISLNDRNMEEQGTHNTKDPRVCSGGTNEKIHGSTCNELNKSEDIVPSVMARLKVLQARNISLNNRNVEEQEALQPAKDARIYPGTDENVQGSSHAENNSEKNDLPMNLAELGFVESVAQPPYANEKCRSWRSFFSSGSFGVTSDELGQCSNASGEENTQHMFSSPLNELLIQSYLAYNQMNHSHGHEVPSFEWEHVLEEESPQHPQ